MIFSKNNLEKSIHDHVAEPGIGITRYPKSWWPQTNYKPVDPNKRNLPELDNHPDAVEAREKAAQKSILVPLAAILGVTAVLIFGVLIKLYF